ncbi:MAG: CRISPR system precrRNA processing endoribonuclease RAMP protein Cas6 [gamma proteobacterium endosymbiont of Lamellibrachia anaximandri]|nr:CRISPR system precrRNA processing endoribonuclease RAMP protein Cas6 [gamma proteobacterium endosymbiont of Lamellibrachia anaximandri]MBL3535707.1 CRISPR system precrRNA processing endoribonuclease RAMP protein Cas6 [gamma proteobacterium endosymbiont of Lamellibrachia anaximandri]
MLRFHCVYAYLFETPPPPKSEKMRRYSNAPHPFVLWPERDQETILTPGKSHAVNLTLIGRANDHLPQIAHSLADAGKHGIGADKGQLKLSRLDYWDFQGSIWRQVEGYPKRISPISPVFPEQPACPASVRVQLLSPLRISYEDPSDTTSGRSRKKIVSREELQFHHFFRNILRRISMLRYFHTDQPLETDFSALTQASRMMEFQKTELKWQDWSRYSNRQHRKVPMGGVMGYFEVGGNLLGHFWPYLWAGQWVHAGKGASMGMGRYRLLPLESL